jgi:hypothetical protein
MQCIHPKHLQALAELVVPNNVPKPLNPQHPKHLQALAELMVPNNVSRGEGLESIPQNHKHRCAERKNSTVDGEKKSFFLKYFVFTCIPQNHKHRCAERKRDGEEMGGRGRRQSERGRERQRVGMRQECENARNASTQKLVAGLFCPE